MCLLLGEREKIGLAKTGEGKGYPLQYSALENSMDCIVHGVAKSQIRLSSFRFLHFLGVWNLGEMTAKCGHTLDVGLDCE